MGGNCEPHLVNRTLTEGQQHNGRKLVGALRSCTNQSGKGPVPENPPSLPLSLAYRYSGSFREGPACFERKARGSGKPTQYMRCSSVASRI